MLLCTPLLSFKNFGYLLLRSKHLLKFICFISNQIFEETHTDSNSKKNEMNFGADLADNGLTHYVYIIPLLSILQVGADNFSPVALSSGIIAVIEMDWQLTFLFPGVCMTGSRQSCIMTVRSTGNQCKHRWFHLFCIHYLVQTFTSYVEAENSCVASLSKFSARILLWQLNMFKATLCGNWQFVRSEVPHS